MSAPTRRATSPPYRTLWTLAVGFLLLDAVLLGWAGLWLGSRALMTWAVLLGLGAAGVIWSWRAYRRRYQEMLKARSLTQREVSGLRDAVGTVRRRSGFDPH